MKIITKDNFCRDYFTEELIAENVNQYLGEQMVKEWNDRHWDEQSSYYLALVEDDYELYDGYADLA
ncbi:MULTISPECIES: hypothetical protein [Bacillus]|uniref:hypothetical protein n=1 Tax=Bacillus TaxID=1386 RepID=UPI00101CAC6A|nr:MULTISPECIES: hypothetical protein [Bacillus]MCP1159307.1 hypothetical protein [Bacillus infantis]MDT0160421.1 hypothetical protein [Bacillus sp. AG4(2022)]RYI30503.1 hypothetical protein EVU96_08805 [Bacillus infantis]